MSLGFQFTGLNEVGTSLKRKVGAVQRLTFDAVKDGAVLVGTYGFILVRTPILKGPASVNVQDSSRARSLRFNASLVQARMDASKNEAQIKFSPHWTGARSKAMKAIAGRVGLNLTRRALWVGKGRKRGNHKGYTSRAGLQKVNFGTKWLVAWGIPKDLNQKDTVRVKGEALRQMVAAPSVSRNAKAILADISTSVDKGFK